MGLLNRLKQVISDIAFLQNQSYFSFGSKHKKYSQPEPAIDTEITHTLCGVPVHIYYYASKNALVYTPGKVHTIYSNNYEGPYHPMCKIDLPRYADYIINEGGVKYNGNRVIFSTTDLENNNPEEYNDDMLAAIVLACFYSLIQRLHSYMYRIEDMGKTIDYGHNTAPIYTYKTIANVLKMFRDTDMKKCVEKLLYTFKPFTITQLMVLFEEIKFFSYEIEHDSPVATERLEFITDMYHTLMEQKEFNKPRIAFKAENPTVKPRRLF
jgi:hypothetical protein